ncbi:FadD7 family fatty acid--CoA ligase [Streptomyces sp. NPDC001984]|uniref:FadD7 family fatty acid--CoA ligase n=1 Tax=Streptomyces sp. NPDC002619 TaxID=3364655 RepID=UPI0036B189BD
MAVPAAASVCDPDRYCPPEITGLSDLLERHVRERPDARALVVGGDRLAVSYATLAALSDDVATRLSGTGLRPGDAIGLVSANTVEFVAALLGGARAGLVVAPIDPALPESQVSPRLEALGVRAVLVGPPAAGAALVAPANVPAWTLHVDVSPSGTATATLETGSPATPPPQSAAGELSSHDALVLFTAGTTDRAKMVPLTHANVAASVRGICATYELGPVDATVAVMPLFHGHGLFAGLLASLATGGCVLLPERGRFSAHTFWDDMRAAGATWFTAVPTIHEVLLKRSATDYPGPQGPPLRFIRSCSAPLNLATQRALEHTLRAPLLSAYGMTESSHQAASEPLPQNGPLKHGSVGVSTGVSLRVLDPDGNPCPVGAEGEVWVQGPTVTRGYLANPAETAHSFTAGWFRTGDLGSLDENGYLFLTGRIKNLINRGGEKISPEHVEDVIAGYPGVAEAAVFAIPDATYGQRVGAAVVLARGESLGAEEILQYCRSRLAPFEIPDRIEFVAALPHTAKGALDRKAVDTQYGH